MLTKKVLTSFFGNYEITWYKTNLDSKLSNKEPKLTFTNITEADLDDYFCQVRDKRSNEYSNIGKASIQLKTDENQNYGQLFCSIYPSVINTDYGQTETLSCLTILLDTIKTNELEFYEPTWYKDNLNNKFEHRKRDFVLTNISDKDIGKKFSAL